MLGLLIAALGGGATSLFIATTFGSEAQLIAMIPIAIVFGTLGHLVEQLR